MKICTTVHLVYVGEHKYTTEHNSTCQRDEAHQDLSSNLLDVNGHSYSWVFSNRPGCVLLYPNTI